MRQEKTWKQCRGLDVEKMFMLGKPSTRPDSDFASVLTSTEFSNPEVFVDVGLSTENSVGEFSMVPNNWVLSVIWLGHGKGLVITILTCNLTSTLQGFDIARDTLSIFWFTRVSYDIQIRQLINDIKCASPLGDCVPLSTATVINIRNLLLKATSYFSPSLHYVWIFTSRKFLIKRNWLDYWVYQCLNLKLRLRQYPSTLLSLSYHKCYKETNDKDIRNDFTILYVRDLILLNRWYTIFAISKLITRLSLLQILLSWSSMQRTRWPPKSPEFISRYRCCV